MDSPAVLLPPAVPGHVMEAELIAVLVAVTANEPRVLTIQDGKAAALRPASSQAIARCRRACGPGSKARPIIRWAMSSSSTPSPIATARQGGAERRVISISYLGLTRQAAMPSPASTDAGWQGWYRYFPWEDWRDGPSALVAQADPAAAAAWAAEAPTPRCDASARSASRPASASASSAWNEELVLQRYELLYEAGLVPEAARRGRWPTPVPPGEPMLHDHRRILATGIARLRAKIKYRPMVFELMPPSFTLLQLQRAVEALAGRRLHKQNFRRLIDQQGLVEETGEMPTETGGRPAKLLPLPARGSARRGGRRHQAAALRSA